MRLMASARSNNALRMAALFAALWLMFLCHVFLILRSETMAHGALYKTRLLLAPLDFLTWPIHAARAGEWSAAALWGSVLVGLALLWFVGGRQRSNAIMRGIAYLSILVFWIFLDFIATMSA